MNMLSHLYGKRRFWKGPIGTDKETYLSCLLLLFLIPVSLNAQTKIEIGENRIAKSTFVAKPSKDGRHIIINESSTIIAKHEDTPGSMQSPGGVRLAKPNSITLAVRKELGTGRMQELSPEKYITVVVYHNGKGKTIAVQFSLDPNSLITLEEIERLNKAIKKNVSFVIPFEPGIDKSKRFIPTAQIVRFDSCSICSLR